MKVLYEERTVSFVENSGKYQALITIPYAFIPAHTYEVVWDGTSYELQATTGEMNGVIVYTCLGGADYPFEILHLGNQSGCYAPNDTEATTHTIAINLISEGDLTVLEKSVLEYGSHSDNGNAYFFFSSSIPQFYPGAEYIVDFNGVECETRAKVVPLADNQTMYGIGNTYIMGVDWTESNLPFALGANVVISTDKDGNETATLVKGFGVTTDYLNDANEYTCGIRLKSLLQEESSGSNTYTVILKEQTMTGFAKIEEAASMYVHTGEAISTAFVDGEEYTVAWDGVEYVCTAEAVEDGGFAIGNAVLESYIGSHDTGEPFLIGFLPSETIILTTKTGESHTLSIYQGEANSNSGAEKKVIMAERTFLSSFWSASTNGSTGATNYDRVIYKYLFSLVAGENYIVTWNGTEYNVTAYELTGEGATYTVLGNTAIMGEGDDTGDPFFMYSLPAEMVGNGTGATVFLTTELPETAYQSFAIYQEISSDSNKTGSTINIISASVVLKDSAGNDTTYSGVKAIKMNAPDGSEQYFVAVEGVPTLD